MGEKGNGGGTLEQTTGGDTGTDAQDEGANDPIGGVGIGLGRKRPEDE
jgi:hypothetical protein